MTLTAVYLAAGVSSRFGGRIKALAQVGKNGEPLMAISMRDARDAGFSRFVIIASPKTVEPLFHEFGAAFLGVPVSYCLQLTPRHREKPFGTAHAILAAEPFVPGGFIVLNGDDLYGAEALKDVAGYLTKNPTGYCIPGYKLKNVVPDSGAVNRGILSVAADTTLLKITETFNIQKSEIPSKYSGEELISMNLFGLQHDFFAFCRRKVEQFIADHPTDPKKEALLPDAVSEFLQQTGRKMHVIPVDDSWLGLTNPEDEEIVRQKIAQL